MHFHALPSAESSSSAEVVVEVGLSAYLVALSAVGLERGEHVGVLLGERRDIVDISIHVRFAANALEEGIVQLAEGQQGAEAVSSIAHVHLNGLAASVIHLVVERRVASTVHVLAFDLEAFVAEQQTAGIPGGVVGPRRIRVGGLGLEFVDDASFKHDIHPVHVQQPGQGERQVGSGNHRVGIFAHIADAAVQASDVQEVSEVVSDAYSLQCVVDAELAVFVGAEQKAASELFVEASGTYVPAVGCETHIEVVAQEVLGCESAAEISAYSGHVSLELDACGEAALGVVELEVVV